MDALGAGLRQPDARSCGAASVVMARLLRVEASSPVPLPVPVPTPEAFRRDVLACHRRLTSARTAGRWQLPWPRALGTPPWAVARELGSITGREHTVRSARWSREAAYERLAASGGVLYVGSRALPRHVLLVLPGGAGALRCYQPSRGTVVELPRTEFVAGRLRTAGWPHPWFSVT